MNQIRKLNSKFVISDTHWNHDNILTFLRRSGKKVRPEFSSVSEMNETIAYRWNSVVSPGDTVYHCGDVAFRKDLSILKRLNGRKILILGNHDNCDMLEYAEYFEEIYSILKLPKIGIIMTHAPMHIDCIKKKYMNVHGHIHEDIVSTNARILEVDFHQQHLKYFNACVEHHNYTPVHMDVIRDRVLVMQEAYGVNK